MSPLFLRHIPRPAGLLAPGKKLQHETEAVMAYAAMVEQREREKLRTEVKIHIPEPEPEPIYETREEKKERRLREMRLSRKWGRSNAWADREITR